MPNELPISRLVNVEVNLSPLPAQIQNISTLLVLGSSNIIDVVERIRSYSSIAAVAADFGTSAAEYLAAVLWFEQAPQPTELKIGRWAEMATAGKLLCASLPAASQLLSAWTGITTGSLKIDVDGGGATDVTGMNFSAATTMPGVAAIIEAKVALAFAGTTVVWNSVYSRFEIESVSTGVGSSVSFLTAAATGVDISTLMAGRAVSSGAYVADGIDAETALVAATLFDANFGQSWYAMTVLGAVNNDHLAVAAYIQAATNKHIYGVSTQEAGVISSVSTTDIAYLLEALGYTRTVVQWSSSNAYSVCSLLGRILTVDYNGNATVITLMYKQEPGIVAETLTPSQLDALTAKKANVFVAYNNSTAIIQSGVVSSGEFLDVVTGTDWLALDIQTAVFNLLYTSTTKIPQTDSGNHLIATAIEAICSQGVANGLLAPGVWTVGGFGSLNQGDFLAKGFYVYAPPVSSQNDSDRALRKSVPIQVAAKLAGAIHTVDIIVNVNR